MSTYDMGVTVTTKGDPEGTVIAAMTLLARAAGLEVDVEPVRGWFHVRKQRVVLSGTMEALARFKEALGVMFPDAPQTYV